MFKKIVLAAAVAGVVAAAIPSAFAAQASTATQAGAASQEVLVTEGLWPKGNH